MYRAHKLDVSQLQPLVSAVDILTHRLAELYDAGCPPPPHTHPLAPALQHQIYDA